MPEDSVSVKMDGDLKTKVRVAAAQADESMSAWIRQAIIEKLERETDAESNRNPAEVLAD